MISQIRRQVLIRYGGNPPTCACHECREQRLEMLEIDHVFGDGASHRTETRLRGDSLIRWLYAHPRLSDYSVLCRPCNLSKADGDACNLDHTEIKEQKQLVTLSIPDEPVMIKKGGDMAGQPKAPREKVTLSLLTINVEYLRAQPGPMNALVDHLIIRARHQMEDDEDDLIENSPEKCPPPQRSLALKYGWLPPRNSRKKVRWWQTSNKA